MTDQAAAGTLLRDEMAQTLGFMLVQLAALERLDNLETLRGGLADLRQTVRGELVHILDLANGLEQQRPSPSSPADTRRQRHESPKLG